MENWFFLFLGLILAYLLEFTRPWVKSKYEESVFSSRKKRIATIINEYQDAKKYKNNPTDLILDGINSIGDFLKRLINVVAGMAIVFIIFADLAQSFNRYEIAALVLIITSLITVGATNLFEKFQSHLKANRSFDDYKALTMAKLKKLGGNPEDLDKEETEGG